MGECKAEEFKAIVEESDLEETAWLLLAGKPWVVTPELLYAVKDMLSEMIDERLK